MGLIIIEEGRLYEKSGLNIEQPKIRNHQYTKVLSNKNKEKMF